MQATERDVPLLLRQACDLLTCLGIAFLVHETNGFKWLQTTGRYMYTSVLHGLKEAWGKECGKSTIFMNQLGQPTHTSCFLQEEQDQVAWKFVSNADSNPRTWVWNFLHPRLDVQCLRPHGHFAITQLTKISSFTLQLCLPIKQELFISNRGELH